ncbi:Acetyl esterase [Brevibacterium ravenspurgense]|uniref:Acetyl esterase n=1 Tax=Brevibacterium ravenspurgense TaxID=479117 RepID=A0A150H6G1_9MICO|nr:alpha/beta hydrolase fold domain-containing protein [Brevibacterium ravenspurgense]KXZ57692.1 Acetyl esterase [Brevibacterium ravenspurgense]
MADEQTFESIPAHIRRAMTPEQAAVVRHQLARTPLGSDGAGADPVEAMRADYNDERAFWNEGGPQMVRTDNMTLPLAGASVPVRIHRPVDAETLPAIIFVHGGGFSVGNLDTHDRIQRVLAAESGAAVIAVDYSLTPEAVFPQALHEVAGAAAYFAARGAEHGIDPKRLAFAGDSAGAILSLTATLLLRDEPGVAVEAAGLSDDPSVGDPAGDSAFESIRSLLLYYGTYGLRDSATMRLYGGWWDGLSRNDLDDMLEAHYRGAQHEASPYVDPLTADYSKPVPPMFIVGAELDPLADDSRALDKVLGTFGRERELHLEEGALHSFLHYGRMMEATRDVLTWGAEYAAARFDDV